jgi:transcriptional regulator with XRE-family HTH domain
MKAIGVSHTASERSGAVVTIGQILRQKRLERGVSGVELTRRANISRSYLTKIEDGTLQDLRLDKFCRITEALGISADELLQEAGYIKAKPKAPFPEPEDYLRERYRLSPEGVERGVEFLEFLVNRERRARRSNG